MKKIEAKIVADSISPQGHRITSMLLTYPRFIHGELLTHRMFSRNSSSSRAIPFEKMVKSIEEDPFIPIAWQKDHKGMQGIEYLNEDVLIEGEIANISTQWLRAKDLAIQQSKRLNECGVTKQLCNRLLEPFMWHTVLVTATEFSNFFELRCPKYRITDNGVLHHFKSKKDARNFALPDHYDGFTDIDWYLSNDSQAEIHIQALAESMWDAYNESAPKQLQSGEWHIPNLGHIWDNYLLAQSSKTGYIEELETLKIKITTAHCAKVSYDNFGKGVDYEADIKLHDRLLESKHFSPFEHCARAMSDEEYYSFIKGKYPTIKEDSGEIVNRELYPQTYFIGIYDALYGWCNNFRGWIQYRYLIENV